MSDKFKSAVLTLPPTIRTELDVLIDKNSSGLSIYKKLKEKYSQTSTIPTVPTLLRYIKYYKVQKGQVQKKIIDEKFAYNFGDGVKEIENILVQISKGSEPNFNKIRLLEGLAGKCIQRVKILEDLPGKADPRVETAIARYISETKSIVESVTKLAEETSKDEQVLIQLIRNESKDLLRTVREIVLDVCPEKYDLFKEKLKVKLKAVGVSIDSLPTSVEQPALPEPTEQVITQPVVTTVTVPSCTPIEIKDEPIEQGIIIDEPSKETSNTNSPE